MAYLCSAKRSLCPSNVEHLALWTFQSIDDMSGFAVNEMLDVILHFRSCVNKILLLDNQDNDDNEDNQDNNDNQDNDDN
jgi:hypothetical protein